MDYTTVHDLDEWMSVYSAQSGSLYVGQGHGVYSCVSERMKNIIRDCNCGTIS